METAKNNSGARFFFSCFDLVPAILPLPAPHLKLLLPFPLFFPNRHGWDETHVISFKVCAVQQIRLAK